MTNNKKDIDKHSGVETTGHEWDGIKELNNPAPRWWLWVFFICCIWAFGYWVVYPAWPTLSGEGVRGGTTGNKNWTQYSQLKDSQAEIKARRDEYLKDFKKSSFEEILENKELYKFALAGAKSSFKDNCATCHGTGGAGGNGYPNLNDDDWIWGGNMQDIYKTIKYGIRNGDDNARDSQMPAFAGVLAKDDILEVSDYVSNLNSSLDNTTKGARIFKENCAVCHGNDGSGNREVGAPNLSDNIWLYGDGSKLSIVSQIQNPKHGVMPAWYGRLDDNTIKQLTIYVHSLGGGE